MGSSKAQTTGYWYSMGLHLGLCHGPVDAVLEIRAGGRAAWTGSVTTNQQISVNAENVFGGAKREGGLVGQLDVMMGGPAQGANDYLTAKQGGLQPGYRGFVGMVWRGGKIAANNPYIKPWWVKLRRTSAGWDTPVWYSAKAAIDLGDGIIAMNPAHILYECITNREWGMGYPSATIDTVSFAAAADIMHAEGMGLCMQWARQDSIQNFMQLVADHIGAGIGEDPRTGLWKLRLIRGGYDINALPVFSPDEGNIVSLDGFERVGGPESMGKLTVTYRDALTGEDGSVTLHSLAAIRSIGAAIPQTRSYPGLPTKALAARIGKRDLTAGSSRLARVQLTLTRDAYGLLPGDVIAFSWPPLGIVNMPLRVGRINYGNITDGKIQLEALEDVFGLPLTSYIRPSAIGWAEPDRTPQASSAVAAFEAPYIDLAGRLGAAEAQAVPTDSGYVGTVARRPNGLAVNYELRTRLGAAAYAQVDDAEWTPTATLSAGIGPTTTLLPLTGADDLDLVQPGGAAMIGAGASAEIVAVESVDLVVGSVVVARGCGDTTPRSWASGTRVWFYDSFAGQDGTEYVATETVDAKIVTRSTGGILAEGLAPGASVTLSRRAARPYPPGDLKINAARYPAEEYGALTATWVHRDRLLQQDTLISHTEASVGPEAGTTYTARWYLDAVLVRTQTSITGTSDTYTPPAGSGGRTIRVEIESARNSLLSWQRAAHTFIYRAQRFTESNDRRVTESGDPRILE